NKKGFTIVELVIVIAVIAILAAVLIPTFSGVIQRANASAALQEATSTMKATLAMSQTGVISDNTIFAIGTDKGITYEYRFINNAIEEIATENITTLTFVNGGTLVGTNETKYDRIIVNNAMISNGAWATGSDVNKIQGIIKSALGASGATLTIQAKGTEKVKNAAVMKDGNAAFELKIVNGTDTIVLAVYVSTDYAKDIVTFVPATQSSN
ncbi:MAG: prepilin-type N-terminal cleavage/methylation domain-containing protein, partial [Clostridia bacterium]|nr:prepilin-type N-terminal cleavage/methylation domain-containing protein [Clostridia bacterium]